uniref:beta-N-acetylhexosaminidase n=1 Tax=Thaumasiovibrio occultus TaxID=1891184 RepID=UPI000B35CE14|nr:beta-N-acetylhexosaminidase [Thaumasiovibrio occultus]
MNNFSLHFVVLESYHRTLRIALELVNRSPRAISDFVLCFDMPRFMDKNQVVNGAVVKQAGSHIEVAPPPSFVLEPDACWRIELYSETAGVTNLGERPMGAYLRHNGETFPVAEGLHNMRQPHSVDLLPLYLPEAKAGIIPQPQHMSVQESSLPIPPVWQMRSNSELAGKAQHWLSEQITFGDDSAVVVSFDEVPEMDDEAYALRVHQDGVTISAGSVGGFLYGAVSLAQLVRTSTDGTIALADIHDAPRFAYRGQFLDCCRSFHGIRTVKAVLERMVWLKLNTFHWHITDDEGWRLELNCFPQLTQVGAWRGDDEALEPQFGSGAHRYGGFFSQQEVKEVLALAESLNITVIPEIDTPGHARALLKALPELLIEAEDKSQYESIQQYTDNVLNPGLDATYRVLETILDEVCELFPSQRIHLGGDEVPKHVWEKSPACLKKQAELGFDDVRDLEWHLMLHMQGHLKAKGRAIGVWEEASHSGKLEDDALVYAWSNAAEGAKAIEAGYKVLMCPAQSTYLDMAWNRDIHEPGVLWAGNITLEKAYAFDPAEGLPEESVVGTQALVWTEIVHDHRILEYMLYPRLFAVAENAWTQPVHKNWDDFQARVAGQIPLLDQDGIHYRQYNKQVPEVKN